MYNHKKSAAAAASVSTSIQMSGEVSRSNHSAHNRNYSAGAMADSPSAHSRRNTNNDNSTHNSNYGVDVMPDFPSAHSRRNTNNDNSTHNRNYGVDVMPDSPSTHSRRNTNNDNNNNNNNGTSVSGDLSMANMMADTMSIHSRRSNQNENSKRTIDRTLEEASLVDNNTNVSNHSRQNYYTNSTGTSVSGELSMANMMTNAVSIHSRRSNQHENSERTIDRTLEEASLVDNNTNVSNHSRQNNASVASVEVSPNKTTTTSIHSRRDEELPLVVRIPNHHRNNQNNRNELMSLPGRIRVPTIKHDRKPSVISISQSLPERLRTTQHPIAGFSGGLKLNHPSKDKFNDAVFREDYHDDDDEDDDNYGDTYDDEDVVREELNYNCAVVRDSNNNNNNGLVVRNKVFPLKSQSRNSEATSNTDTSQASGSYFYGNGVIVSGGPPDEKFLDEFGNRCSRFVNREIIINDHIASHAASRRNQKISESGGDRAAFKESCFTADSFRYRALLLFFMASTLFLLLLLVMGVGGNNSSSSSDYDGDDLFQDDDDDYPMEEESRGGVGTVTIGL